MDKFKIHLLHFRSGSITKPKMDTCQRSIHTFASGACLDDKKICKDHVSPHSHDAWTIELYFWLITRCIVGLQGL